MESILRKCPYCGTENLNRDYCKNCGKLINTILKRKQEREKKILEKQKLQAKEKPNKITDFFEKAKVHKNPLIRFPAWFFYSIWFVILGVGSLLAFIITYIAA